MNWIDIVIIIVCVIFVGAVIMGCIQNRKKGKTTCGCDCSKCSGCAQYKNNDKNTNK